MTGCGMHNVATLAERAIHQTQAEAHTDPLAGVSATIRKLFMLLHGSYGNAFISKFSTGEKLQVGDKQHDKGVLTAMKVWNAQLAKYSSEVVETAAGRATEAHKQFPPNLAEFEALCRAAQPRKTHAELAGWAALPPPAKPKPIEVHIELVGDGKDGYRKILARAKAGDKTISRFALEAAMQVFGIKKGELV